MHLLVLQLQIKALCKTNEWIQSTENTAGAFIKKWVQEGYVYVCDMFNR